MEKEGLQIQIKSEKHGIKCGFDGWRFGGVNICVHWKAMFYFNDFY